MARTVLSSGASVVARLAAMPVRAAAHLAAAPLRALAREREPAVADPGALHPGDAPPTDGRLLVLFDGACGICLHVRDLIAVADRSGRLSYDRIARHDHGLLAELSTDRTYGEWHVVHPDGRMEHGAAGVAAVLAVLPGGRVPARAMRRFPRAADRAYRWFARNRGWISRGTGLINHPQRVADEGPTAQHGP